MLKSKKIINISTLLLCVLVLSLLLSACDSGETDNTSTERYTYSVQVKSEGGMPLADIGVYIYADDSLEKLVWADETDKNGNLEFDAAASPDYVAVLKDVPNGYDSESYYSISKAKNDIVLNISINDSVKLNDTKLDIGSVICDFTVTAVDGKEYNIKELLETKKAVVLNFWFINCGPCKSEFPYLQDAYDEYKDGIEVLAINPVDGTNSSVEKYANSIGLEFPMAVGGYEWVSAFELAGFPTTVVIDRYGTVSMVHMGAVTESGVFEKIFDFYTSEEYIQTTVRNLADISQ